MKNFNFSRRLLPLIALLLTLSLPLWAEDVTLKFETIGSSLGSTSNTTVSTVTITPAETSTAYTLNYLQGKKQGSAILLAKSTGAFISNRTPIPGDIKSVKVYINSGASGKTTYHCAFSTTECTSAYTTGSTAVNIAGGGTNEYNCSVSGARYFCISLGNANNGQVLGFDVTYTTSGGDPSKTTPELSFESTTYNATMGESFTTPTLTNSQNVTVTYASSKTSVATVNSTTGAISLVGPGTTTITASYDGSESDTYNSNQASYDLVVKPAPFANLEALVAVDLASGTEVTVSFENVPIKDIFVTNNGYRNGIYFDIQKGGKDIEIYFQNVPNDWVVGGTVSGTLTNCPWKIYSGTWELAPASGWAWTDLTYNAPVQKTITALAVSGTPTKTTYNVGDEFDPAGLVVTATYSDDSQETISTGFNWTFDYGTDNTALVAGATSVNVKVSTDEVESENYTVTGLTITVPVTLASIAVSGTPTKTNYYAGDAFDPAGLVVTGTYSDGTTAPITEGIDWNIVPATLNAGATSVSVTATVSSVTSGSYIVNGLTVTANPYQTATISSFSAASGDINSAITYEAFKGNASTAPYINADLNALRLYQNGGYVTITALTGLKIASVKISTSATYESTTVGYCVDDEDAPTSGETVAKSSDYTISGLNNNSVSIYCLGTDKNTRLEIAAIEVKYFGTPVVELKNIALSGTYPTEFTQGDAFSHEGMIVTANYTDDTHADVTSSATFSDYDMSTLGEQTVTVSYTEDEITKTTQYQITVNKAPFVPTPAPNGYEAVNFTTIEPYASLTGSQSANVEDYEGSSFSMAFAKPQSSSTPTKYYNSGASVRAYKDNTITITGAENITNVDIAWVTGYVDDAVSITGLGTTTAVVTFSKTCRFTKIVVNYNKYTRSVTSGNYGTICLPFAVNAAAVANSNATFYSIAGVLKDNENITGIVTTEVEGGLVAGTPYIFKANAAEITCAYSGEPVNEPVAATGLVGSFTEQTATYNTGAEDNLIYFFKNNVLYHWTGTGEVTRQAYKAIVNLNGVAEYTAPLEAPGVHRIAAHLDGTDTATGLDELNAATIQKFFQNGQVYILREGRLYDVTGRLVK